MRKPFYYNRDKDYKKAIELRKKGFGYRTIANQLSNKISWGTIKGWVKHIPINSKIAHKNATLLRMKQNPEELNNQESVKKLIIKERGEKCENCGISTWQGKKIIIELHHVDGDNKNNQRKNLKLLCPNCHSQTDNYKNKKRLTDM